jgi:hypothetical protein
MALKPIGEVEFVVDIAQGLAYEALRLNNHPLRP